MNKLLQQLPSFGLLSSNILSRFSSSRGKSSSSEQSRSNGTRATYADLEAARTGSKTRNCVMRPVKSMQSYVHTGRPDHLEEDGIHLQVNINQSISSSEQDAVRGYWPELCAKACKHLLKGDHDPMGNKYLHFLLQTRNVYLKNDVTAIASFSENVACAPRLLRFWPSIRK